MAPIKFGKLLLFVILFLFSNYAFGGENIPSLPGYVGDLPFTLQTGYTSVGDVEFFYYFVESENNPALDPILLYFNGGPGCTALNGLFYQVGPLKFDLDSYTGGLPSLLYVEDSWSKTVNILFLDTPVGTGFSYAMTQEAWNSTDTQSAQQISQFLRNWLTNHTEYQTNPIYVGSDSYSGIINPIVAQDILDGNKAGLEPIINLKGMSLGCPHTDTVIEDNAKIPFAHRLTLISDAMFLTAESSCNGSYAEIDESNTKCVDAVDAIDQCIDLVSRQNVLEPECAFISPREKENAVSRTLKSIRENIIQPFPNKLGELYCHTYQYLFLDIWLNYKSVQEALHVRSGTTGEFYRCNISLSYTSDMDSVLAYHENLTTQGLQVLVFSGDHDMIMPHNGVEKWITSLGLTIDSDWRPWFIEGQVAGYTTKYTNDGYRLTYATIKGAGHSPQEYKRKVCYDMFHRWVRYYPL
ncbi:serine carboxypeptidase-like 7 [Euphorbia peplus]|nr:serine carboxypeptidase-like 7 [Euphorbia peplus]